MTGALAELFAGGEATAITAFCVFARVAAALFLAPGFGERAMPMRMRLAAALLITLALAPVVEGFLAHRPESTVGFVHAILGEAASGLVIGLAFRLLVLTLQVAGTVAAQNVSISHVFGTGVAQSAEPTFATFLAMGGIALLFAGGYHVDLVAAFVRLYEPLPFAALPSAPDLAEWGAARVGETFALGVSLALPFVAVGFAYNLALAALSRAMPQLLVALVGVPLLVGLALFDRHDPVPNPLGQQLRRPLSRGPVLDRANQDHRLSRHEVPIAELHGR